MKIAVLSDIHGNLEALDAVVQDLDLLNADTVICLGDLVGYGPDPEEVVSRVRALGYESLLGNHEAALMSKNARNWMNFQAKENSEVTEGMLSAENLQYCCGLPRAIRLAGALFVHGAPPKSVSTYLYMMEKEHIEKIFSQCSEKLFFVGHTHQLKLVTLDDGEVCRRKLTAGETITLDEDRKYLINCGSVGQPRDGDNRAKYIIWDTTVNTLDIRGVPYDADLTAEKISRRGFPKIYGDRLR